MEMEAAVPSAKPRQMKLFPLTGSMSERFDTAFFATVPISPGVYFFRDATGVLLYIGQSGNLRARVGSYRHVSMERHPRRLRRLVHRIASIEWQVCETAKEAVELERVLLLERRPPFNRAGVWAGPPWWFAIHGGHGVRRVQLLREPLTGPQTDVRCVGPLPSSFRYVFGSLLRWVYRLSQPDSPLPTGPMGIYNLRAPLEAILPTTVCVDTLYAFVAERNEALLEPALTPPQDELPTPPTALTDYWEAELKVLRRYCARPSVVTLFEPPASKPSAHLSLFPEW